MLHNFGCSSNLVWFRGEQPSTLVSYPVACGNSKRSLNSPKQQSYKRYNFSCITEQVAENFASDSICGGQSSLLESEYLSLKHEAATTGESSNKASLPCSASLSNHNIFKKGQRYVNILEQLDKRRNRWFRLVKYRGKKLQRKYSNSIRYPCRQAVARKRNRLNGQFLPGTVGHVVIEHQEKVGSKQNDVKSTREMDRYLETCGQDFFGWGTENSMEEKYGDWNDWLHTSDNFYAFE